jgi:hypothetical protein
LKRSLVLERGAGGSDAFEEVITVTSSVVAIGLAQSMVRARDEFTYRASRAWISASVSLCHREGGFLLLCSIAGSGSVRSDEIIICYEFNSHGYLLG